MGNYVNKNLTKNESVLAEAKTHWFIYVPSTFIILFSLSLFDTPESEAAGAIVLFIGLFFLLNAAVYVYSTELAITSKRVIAKYGFIKRHTIELNHKKVESIAVDQSIMGRIFNFGTIHVNGTGGASAPIKKISRPLEFRKVALDKLDDEG